MNAEMELKRTVLKQAIERYKGCLSEMRKAEDELKQIGVEVQSVSVRPRKARPEIDIWLNYGITEVSVISETEIRSREGWGWGTVDTQDVEFTQNKLPVEKVVDRYA